MPTVLRNVQKRSFFKERCSFQQRYPLYSMSRFTVLYTVICQSHIWRVPHGQHFESSQRNCHYYLSFQRRFSLLPGLIFCLFNHQAFSNLLFHIRNNEYFFSQFEEKFYIVKGISLIFAYNVHT